MEATIEKLDLRKADPNYYSAKKNPELKEELEQNPTSAELWKTSMFLEGLTRGTGIHAAGVVIGDRELTDYVPLIRGKEGEVVTQIAMSPLTDLGMLKMDFLGLKTLTVIQDAIDLIHRHTPDFVLDNEGYDATAAFELLNRGRKHPHIKKKPIIVAEEPWLLILTNYS